MKRLSKLLETRGVPEGLPDHLRAPVIPLDPRADQQTRRFHAYEAFRAYTLELSRWIPPEGDAGTIQAALGTTLADFLVVADGATVR